MALEFSTAGISVKYKVASSQARPTSGYTEIPDIVGIGEINGEPSNIDVTNLKDLIRKRSIAGLIDNSGSIPLTVNGTADFKSKWEALVTAAKTGKASGFNTWFEIVIPAYTDSFYFAGEPQDLGFFGAEVDSAYKGDVYVSLNEFEGFKPKSN